MSQKQLFRNWVSHYEAESHRSTLLVAVNYETLWYQTGHKRRSILVTRFIKGSTTSSEGHLKPD